MTQEFDRYAQTYDEELNKSLESYGEDKNFFAQGRLRWLAGRLRGIGVQPKAVLDFGCGTGSATPFLFSAMDAQSVVGVDVSRDSLAVARTEHGSDRASFVHQAELEPSAGFDLALCNGVFHHIPVAERASAVDYVFRSLRPGGIFAFFENNALHPGTRYAMWRSPLDKGAIPIGPLAARRMLGKGRFKLAGTDFLFVFPKPLAALRWSEPYLCRIPLGAQFLVLCSKPA